MKILSRIREATVDDLDGIASVYDHIHTAEEKGETSIGWIRSIYPTRKTAEAALTRGDIFVQTDEDGRVVGTAIINKVQVDVYADAPWEYDVPDEQVMVLHTLVIDPKEKGKGYGTAFVRFYEQFALKHGCPYLRMDTNEKNVAARAFYKKLGYREIAVRPCEFNGIPGVRLVLLEKKV